MSTTTFEWHYVPAKWYALKHRGGMLVCDADFISVSVEQAMRKILKQDSPFEFIARASRDGAVDFKYEEHSYFENGRTGPHSLKKRMCIKFKRQSDAIQFKFLYMSA